MSRRTTKGIRTTIPFVALDAAGLRVDPPSSAWDPAAVPADEEAGSLFADEDFIQLADGDDWPSHFGAARLGVP